MFCSVAMSTYNGERFLAEQLSSICAQTRPVDEIVVSDDGSSDGTLRILDDFRLAHPQIHWKILSSAENHGFRESFLRALKACGGDLIFLCDQDTAGRPARSKPCCATSRPTPPCSPSSPISRPSTRTETF